MPRPKDGYRLKSGKRVPGVTTITGTLDDGKSDRFIGWAINEMEAGRNPRDTKDKSADVGTAGHALIEAVSTSKPGEIVDLDATLIPFKREVHGPALMVLASFNELAQEKEIRVRAAEEVIVSETWKFGSTLDLVAESKKGLQLWDYKSGGAYANCWIELAARKVLWEEAHPGEPITGGFVILQLNRTSLAYSYNWYKELPGAWDIFVNLLDNYRLLKEFKSYLKGKLD